MQKTYCRTPFTAGYWREAAAEFGKTRSLTIAALLTALCIAVEKFNLPIMPELQLSLSYIPVSLCSFLTGPLMAIPCGIIADLVGVIGSPYPCFLGYTLSAVLGAVLYALFLYRAPLTLSRFLGARFSVNLLVNTLLGSVWRVMLYRGMTYGGYAALAGIKNLLLAPIEVLVMLTVFRALQKPLEQMGLVPHGHTLSVTKRQVIGLLAVFAVCVLCLIPFAMYYDEIKLFFKTFRF